MNDSPSTRAALDDVRAVYERLFDPSTSRSSLQDAIVSGHFYPPGVYEKYDSSTGMLPGRSILWKHLLLFSTPLATPSSQPPIAILRRAREKYVHLVKTELCSPDGKYEEWVEIPGLDPQELAHQASTGNIERNNPLSLEADSGWNDWFAAVDLRKTIRQDVERTFPDIPYFRDSRVQSLMTTILYLYANANPNVGYRQGMHELLAPLLYAVDFDALPSSPSSLSSPASDSTPSPPSQTLSELCSSTYIAADAHALFTTLMSKIGSWYEWQEPLPSSSTSSTSASGQPVASTSGRMELPRPYVAPIVETCHQVFDSYLKPCDPALWSALGRNQIEPQIYGIRWLRLLFTREFPIAQAMALWDGLFALDPTLQLSKWICVAMLIRIRNDLIPADYSGQLTYLLRYPSHTPLNSSFASLSSSSTSSSSSLAQSTLLSTSLLLTQAQILESAPNPASGATVAMQNRDALGLPMEVPEPETPPPRTRRAAGGTRTGNERRVQSQSHIIGSSSSSGFDRRLGKLPQFGGGAASGPTSPSLQYGINLGNTLRSQLGSYADQYMNNARAAGLPELFSKGLSDVGGVVSGAVGELRRNLPEIQPRTSSPPIAFPYTNTQALSLSRPSESSASLATEDRPPWEPRTRFEIEREITELRALNKRLGQTLTWAVDALLLSSDEGDKEVVEKRKREAVESLAYVRDVLNAGRVQAPAELDEEKLVGEEELRKIRAARKEAERARVEEEKKSLEEERERERLAKSMGPLGGVIETATATPVAPAIAAASSSAGRGKTNTTASPAGSSGSSTPVTGLPRSSSHAKSATVASSSPIQPPIATSSFLSPLAATARASSTPSSRIGSSARLGANASSSSSPSPNVAPWHSTPSTFASFDAGNSLRPPPAAASAAPAPGAVRARSSPETSPPTTYQSDPLRG